MLTVDLYEDSVSEINIKPRRMQWTVDGNLSLFMLTLL